MTSYKSTPLPQDQLIAGDHPLYHVNGTLAAGETLTRGALVGKVTGSGEFRLSATGNADGSEVPYGVLVDDVDAGGGALPCSVYVCGRFNSNQLTFGTGHTAASVEDGLLLRSIYLSAGVAA